MVKSMYNPMYNPIYDLKTTPRDGNYLDGVRQGEPEGQLRRLELLLVQPDYPLARDPILEGTQRKPNRFKNPGSENPQ